MSISFQFNEDQLFADIKEWARLNEIGFEKAIAAVTVEVKSAVAKRTPVDIGNARASWRHQKLSPKAYVVFNEAVYAPALEFGHSKQAPYGMLRVTLATMQHAIGTEIDRELTPLARGYTANRAHRKAPRGVYAAPHPWNEIPLGEITHGC